MGRLRAWLVVFVVLAFLATFLYVPTATYTNITPAAVTAIFSAGQGPLVVGQPRRDDALAPTGHWRWVWTNIDFWFADDPATRYVDGARPGTPPAVWDAIDWPVVILEQLVVLLLGAAFIALAVVRERILRRRRLAGG